LLSCSSLTVLLPMSSPIVGGADRLNMLKTVPQW